VKKPIIIIHSVTMLLFLTAGNVFSSVGICRAFKTPGGEWVSVDQEEVVDAGDLFFFFNPAYDEFKIDMINNTSRIIYIDLDNSTYLDSEKNSSRLINKNIGRRDIWSPQLNPEIKSDEKITLTIVPEEFLKWSNGRNQWMSKPLFSYSDINTDVNVYLSIIINEKEQFFAFKYRVVQYDPRTTPNLPENDRIAKFALSGFMLLAATMLAVVISHMI